MPTLLANATVHAQIGPMSFGDRWRAFERIPPVRTTLLVLGIFLLAIGPIVGLLPGPGGIPVMILGLSLMLRYSRWSKRMYVRVKRRWPKHGALADRGLRRPSARRRHELAKQQAD